MNGTPGQPSYLIKTGRKSSVQQTTTFPWWSQPCKQPITRTKFYATGSHHKLWSTTSGRVETQLPEWLESFTEGLTRGLSSSTDVSAADVAVPLPAIFQQFMISHPPAKLTSESSGGKYISYSLTFPKTQNAKHAGARNLRERHSEEILTIGRTQLRLLEDLEMW